MPLPWNLVDSIDFANFVIDILKENNFMKEENQVKGKDDEIFKNIDQDLLNGDYGKMKMEIFKNKCRNIHLNENS